MLAAIDHLFVRVGCYFSPVFISFLVKYRLKFYKLTGGCSNILVLVLVVECNTLLVQSDSLRGH
jgi:hypothetical protein